MVTLRLREPTFRDAIDAAVRGERKHLIAMILDGHPRTEPDRNLLASYVAGNFKRRAGRPSNSNSDALTPFGFDPRKVKVTDLQIAAIQVEEELDAAKKRGDKIYGLRAELVAEFASTYNLSTVSVEKEIERQRKKYPRKNK